MVRHQVLVLAFGGSNPSALAKARKSDHVSGFFTLPGEVRFERQGSVNPGRPLARRVM